MLTKFNYKKFATYLRDEAEKNIPEDIAKKYKKQFLATIYNFSLVTGESLYKDIEIKDHDDLTLMMQLLSEWTFHKYIDLLRSDIPAMYHNGILKKVGFTVFEMAKQSIAMGLSTDEICKLMEVHVNKSYGNACRFLKERNIITQEILENALKLSNAEQMEIDSTVAIPLTIKPEKKSTNICTLAAMVVGFFTLIMNVWFPDYANIRELNVGVVIALTAYMLILAAYKKIKTK